MDWEFYVIKITIRLKGKCCHIVVTLALLYGQNVGD